MGLRKFNKEDYDKIVKKYIMLSEERDKPITEPELKLPQYNLPGARWLVANCPDKNVDSFLKFKDWCGFFTSKTTKEKAIDLIYRQQEQTDHPLMYDDFRGVGCYKVSIKFIRDTWGTINKVKEELGLEIVQESMIDKVPTKEKFDEYINQICDMIGENRDFVTTDEINKNKDILNMGSLNKYAKKFYDCNVSDLLAKNGYRLGEQGRGIKFVFPDGEKTTSQWEYLFSSYLRKHGFVYNESYFRDVKYSDFINDYNENMNCDYKIKVNDEWIYVEIAGILNEFKLCYYRNQALKVGSREKYRMKLMKKETMLKNNNLKYFILFPCDLTNDNMNKIISAPTLELKHKIEQFNQANIDWKVVREKGELNYESDDIYTYKKR